MTEIDAAPAYSIDWAAVLWYVVVASGPAVAAVYGIAWVLSQRERPEDSGFDRVPWVDRNGDLRRP